MGEKWLKAASRWKWLWRHAREESRQGLGAGMLAVRRLASFLGMSAIVAALCAAIVGAAGWKMAARGDWPFALAALAAFAIFWPRGLSGKMLGHCQRLVESDLAFVERSRERDRLWQAQEEARKIGESAASGAKPKGGAKRL